MSILEELGYNGNGRIVNISLSADKKAVELEEACDAYYSRELNKSEFGQFINELKELHAQMIDS